MKDSRFKTVKDVIDESLFDSYENWGTLGAHDPSIIKVENSYYVFSTDAIVGGNAKAAIQLRKSNDLVNWTYIGTAINDIPKEAAQWTGASGLWAPEVIKIKDEYFLYYCASTFGKNRSCIGLLKGPSINGPWTDCGLVIKTDICDNRNAIDPNLLIDKYGQLWMSYGSFWSGIYVVKLDSDSGKIASKDDIGNQIASRPYYTEGAIEGPYIIYNKDFDKYYLFISFDSLGSDYNVRVGRADNIEGPYLDINGVDLKDVNVINPNHVGNKILGSYKFGNTEGWIAPGHNSILNDNNSYYIVHHARKEYNHNWFYMHVRKILWNKNGWPMVLPQRYAGEVEEKIEYTLAVGKWEVLFLYRDVNRPNVSKICDFHEDFKVSGAYSGLWNGYDENCVYIKLLVNDTVQEYDGKIISVWDWEENKATLAITAINSNGIALWAKMI